MKYLILISFLLSPLYAFSDDMPSLEEQGRLLKKMEQTYKNDPEKMATLKEIRKMYELKKKEASAH